MCAEPPLPLLWKPVLQMRRERDALEVARENHTKEWMEEGREVGVIEKVLNCLNEPLGGNVRESDRREGESCGYWEIEQIADPLILVDTCPPCAIEPWLVTRRRSLSLHSLVLPLAQKGGVGENMAPTTH